MMGRHDDDPDREARFLELWERNRRRVERLCHVYSRPSEVDDLRNEVAFQLWRSLDRFAGRSAADTWVYRVALNTALRFARDGRRRRHEALDDPEALVARGPSAAGRLEDEERRRRLVRAMYRLPELDRAVLALHLDELSYREIAEVTGLTPNHVGVRLHRARRRLTDLMDGATR